MARLLPCGQYAFAVALLALPIRATYLRCARLLPCGQYAFAVALLALPIRATYLRCARLLPCGQYAFAVALLALPIRATYLRCARLLPCGQYAFAVALLALPIRATCAAMCSLRCAHTPRFSGSQSIPPSHLFHICRRQMSIPPRIFFTSAVGRCPSPLASFSHLP